MRLSKEGLVFLGELEGIKQHPYLDTKGIPTIGLGNTTYENGTKVRMKDPPISMERIYELQKITGVKYENAIKESIKVPLTQNQYDALFMLVWNIGPFGFKNSTIVKKINNQSPQEDIEKAWMMWTKNKELIPRREKEILLYFKK